ncbi:MAG: outer membrane protein assembly factor BamC [Pseudomonadota bacterium]
MGSTQSAGSTADGQTATSSAEECFAARALGLLRTATLAILCALLSSCGYLFGDNGVFRDTSGDYRRAQETPLMQLPAGAGEKQLTEIYAIPVVTAEEEPTRGDRVPRPTPLVAASAEQLVRIQRLGDDSWALIAIAPGQLWPQVRSFLTAANMDVARLDAREGIIETTYLDLTNQELSSRFRFRIERGVQRGNSELHVLQMHQSASAEWPTSSDDVDLEGEMLRGVAQYIANSADTAPVSMMAEQSMSASGKVALRDDDLGDYINLELPFNRAWASLARALDQSGFQINDRNRSDGKYYVSYENEEGDGKSGWFGWLWGGGDEHPATGVPLLLSMQRAGDEEMVIRLREESSTSLEEDDIRSLLVLIKGNIN